MNLFAKFESGLPLTDFLAKYGTAAHRARWKSAAEQTTLTDAQRKLLGTFTRRTNVLVLAGGLSPEREVSLRSGARLRDALREAGVDADTADADAGLIPAITADPPSAVFPAIHGASGEDASPVSGPNRP